MSTRAVIARPTADGWEGVYHHFDGYPTGLGVKLHRIHADVFDGDTDAMLRFIIDEHPSGWSHLGDGDPASPHGIGRHGGPNPYDYSTQPDEAAEYDRVQMQRPACYCHPDGIENPRPRRDLHTSDSYASDIEYVYVLDDGGLDIHEARGDGLHRIGRVAWGQQMTGRDWTAIECGEHYERCRHIASYHFENVPEAYRSLGTVTLLGYREVPDEDAPELRLTDGTVVRVTGSGHAEGLHFHMGPEFRRFAAPCERKGGKRWFGDVQYPDGTRKTIPLYYQSGPRAGQLCDGMQAVHAPVFTIAQLGEKELELA